MGNYDDVARREKERQEKGRGKVSFEPVIYGEEKRCQTCWSRLNKVEDSVGDDKWYCFNCHTARANAK